MEALLYFLRRYVRSYSTLLAVVIAAAVVDALAVAALYPLLTLVLDAGSPESGGRVLAPMRAIVNRFPENHRLAGLLALYLGILALNTALQLLREWRTAETSGYVGYDVKQLLFLRYVAAPYQYFLQTRQGDLTYRLSTAATNLAFCLYLITAVASSAFTASFILVVLGSISWKLTIVLLLIGAGLFLANRSVAQNVSAWTGRGKQAAASTELDLVQEFVTGAKEINVGGVGSVWASRFSEQGSRFRKLYVRDLVWGAVPSQASELVVFGVVGIVLVIARAQGVEQVRDMLPVAAVFFYGVRQLLTTASALGRQALRVAGLLPDVALLQRSLKEAYPDVREGNILEVPAWKRLAFENVSLTYASRTEQALNGASFSVDRGRVVAVVGASGAGKTSIASLLLRLFDPTSGAITLDGVPLVDFSRAAWLGTIGYVSQENFIFNGSIADNIRFGRVFSMDEIETAARAAFAHEFVTALPNGYETLAGSHGMTLSGGQRQRLAIARALLRRPTLLVLDEATSSLDSQSEALIQKALIALRGQCTQVIIAHRLSTVRDADQIVVLDGGRVVEIGTYDELLDQGGRFAELVAGDQPLEAELA
jgi:ABC-type multidrug transport system fused ATPase/permease subunit